MTERDPQGQPSLGCSVDGDKGECVSGRGSVAAGPASGGRLASRGTGHAITISPTPPSADVQHLDGGRTSRPSRPRGQVSPRPPPGPSRGAGAARAYPQFNSIVPNSGHRLRRRPVGPPRLATRPAGRTASSAGAEESAERQRDEPQPSQRKKTVSARRHRAPRPRGASSMIEFMSTAKDGKDCPGRGNRGSKLPRRSRALQGQPRSSGIGLVLAAAAATDFAHCPARAFTSARELLA